MWSLKCLLLGFFMGQLCVDFQFDRRLARAGPRDRAIILSTYRYYVTLQSGGHIKLCMNVALALTAILVIRDLATRSLLADYVMTLTFVCGASYFTSVVRPAAERLKSMPTLTEDTPSPRWPPAREVLTTIYKGHVVLFAIVVLSFGLEVGADW